MAKFTKQAIYESFLRFLGEKPFDRITVCDIVEDCGINRKTFYYYFNDIYALAEELFAAETDTVWNKLAGSRANVASWTDAALKLMQLLYENKNITLHMFASFGYGKTEGYLYTVFMKYIPGIISCTDGDCRDEDVTAVSECLSFMMSGIFTRWINGGMKDDPGELLGRYAGVLLGAEAAMLENARRANRDK